MTGCRRRRTLLLDGAAIWLLAAMPHATLDARGRPDRYVAEVLLQLERVQIALGKGGYAPGQTPLIEKLARNASLGHAVALQTGLDYAIVSVCDFDCDNVDISVMDENGNTAGTDASEDDVPVAALSPVWPGQFTINVTAPGCRAARACFT